MQDFITYREASGGELQYFILQKEWPHYLGMIVDNPNFKSLYLFPIPNTILYIAFVGTLQGRLMPAFYNVDKEIAAIFTSMAEWYYENRIANNKKRYKKWLLNQEQTTS